MYFGPHIKIFTPWVIKKPCTVCGYIGKVKDIDGNEITCSNCNGEGKYIPKIIY